MKLPIKTKEDYKMKFISWNVNGFRAVLKKGFEEIFNELDADFFCLQETKMQEGQADFHPEGYYEYYSYAEKKVTQELRFSQRRAAKCHIRNRWKAQ